MAHLELITQLGDEVEDASEETFLLFSQETPSSQNLGIIDDRAPLLALTIGKRDLTIRQAPTVLNSTREGGTTGAVVWKVTPRFATWLASPDNLLFRTSVLSQNSTVLEIGAGIAGVVPALLAPLIKHYIATDQSYALKLLRENIVANSITQVGSNRAQQKTPRRVKVEAARNVDVLPLDWETDDVQSLLRSNDASRKGVDLVVACDCIYNYALIKPFVQTCMDVCRMRGSDDNSDDKPTVCVVAQQLRQPDVFEEWLAEFGRAFRTWRVPDDVLTPELRENSGFVLHMGILKR
ncbi:hypothetical protein AAFC00_002484 [Neodothiora populina]|uniref:Diaminohydroxyphosphoribosylamino-pyrimidine deaminase n=1 Tax=Neodothiora populina TaxID=2781224 RepID=A0ABR3P792_9PEZI